jgi:hypothetical protein
MRVKHGTGAADVGDLDVESGFGRRTAGSAAGHVAESIDLQDLIGRQIAFRHAARGDCQTQRLSPDDDAEVAARAEHPATLIEPASGPDELIGGSGKARQAIGAYGSQHPIIDLGGSAKGDQVHAVSL